MRRIAWHTCALADAGGIVIPGQTFDYDAFGDERTGHASTARTGWLFGGDGVFDPASGLTDQLARWRNGARFTTADKMPGSASDPLGLNRYDYADADPADNADPSGHDATGLSIAGGMEAGEVGEGLSVIGEGASLREQIEGAVTGFEAVQSGFVNMSMAGPNIDPAAAFAVGFASGFATEALTFATGNCHIGNGVGQAILSAGNDYLDKGSLSGGDLGSAIATGLISGLLFGCFVGGTPVLMGDGSTQAIDQIHVGERVTTDGGVANSPDGKTKAQDPNATAVDPKTWREVTITAGDWQVDTLEPMNWVTNQKLHVHSTISLSGIVDLQEMGAPAGLMGTIQSIGTCPTIEAGTGRVVTTTVSHLNADLYHLTLKGQDGQAETLGVTGTHRLYDESLGWVHVADMHEGEVLRSDHGDVTVSGLNRDAGTFRVYNMTVEGDHVYYVGDLTVLTHNNCSENADELRDNLIRDGQSEAKYAAHIVPSGDFASEMHELLEEAGVDINDSENGFFTDSARHNGTHTTQFLNDLYKALTETDGSYEEIADALEHLKQSALGGNY